MQALLQWNLISILSDSIVDTKNLGRELYVSHWLLNDTIHNPGFGHVLTLPVRLLSII
jgi:hypothetical protein